MRKTFAACVLAFGFTVIGAPSAWAQADTFMFVPGIPGGSIDDRHEDWIDVMSITQTLDSNGKRRSSCEIQASKRLDIAGPLLWVAAVTGQVFPEVRVEVLRPGDKPFLIYELKLGNARVSTIATSINTGDLAETFSLVAETATLTVFRQPGPPVTATISCR